MEETKYSCVFIEFGDGVLTPRLGGDDPAFEFGADVGNHVTDSTTSYLLQRRTKKKSVCKGWCQQQGENGAVCISSQTMLVLTRTPH